MYVDGQCHCGAIRFDADIDPDRVFVCHCEDCQSFSGSAFRVRIMVATEAFRVTQGTPRAYSKVAESGNERVMHFCENCGTHIYGSAAGEGPFVTVSGGAVRQKADIAPAMQVWCGSRLPWIAHLEEIRKAEKQ